MPGGELVEGMRIPPPMRGLLDGLDPASPDDLFPPLFTPDAQNLRFLFGKWETRLGQVLWKTLPGSGDVRLLDNLYLSTGGKFRLAARGTGAAGIFYDYQEGTDTEFQATTGGTGLGGTVFPYFQGVTLNDLYYFTDRVGLLKVYNPSTSPGVVADVTQPATPTVAPVVRARWYRLLAEWRGSAPFNWTESQLIDYDISDATSTDPPPAGTKTARLRINTGSAQGDTIRQNITGEELNSHTIAFLYKQTNNRDSQQFQFGILNQDDYRVTLRAPTKDEWYPKFFPVGDVPSINYKQFKVINARVSSDYVTQIFLPGRLLGTYQWIYTHYNPTTGQESEPSPPSNNGVPSDYSMLGKDDDQSTAGAINKAALITFTSDAGTDATTTQVRIYRNGGVPSLTKDSQGKNVWLRVGTVNDVSTTIATTAATAGDLSITVADATGIAIGDTLVIDKGAVGAEEFVEVTGIVGNVLQVRENLLYNHAIGQPVQMAFKDNVANEQIDVTADISLERDPPPAGARWIGRSPEGRLWLFGYAAKLTGVRVSNRATPERPHDYTVFPDGVDPLTRQDINQGWGFEIGGDAIDEEIMWGGFFGGLPVVLTKRNLYRINALSQLDWGPFAIEPLLNVGCIAGETVQEVNGTLMWVAPGPRIMRWDGQNAPQDIAFDRVSLVLSSAPTAHWTQWFARVHAKRDGHYYCLYLTPSGATTNTLRLDINTTRNPEGVWEPQAFRDAASVTLGFRGAAVRHGGTDVQELYQVEGASGRIYQTEVGLTDDGAPIAVRGTTKRFDLGMVGMLHTLYLRLAPVTDTVTLVATCGGSEYGNVSQSYTVTLTGTGVDHEVRVRLHRTLKGRWVSFSFSGDVSNRPAIRDMRFNYLPWRTVRYG